ncbi:MAG: sodium/glutamate symporter [Wolinella sp.]
MGTVEIQVDGYYTLILATLVLLLGRFLVKKIRFLRDFNIPEPVVGGLIAAIVMTILYATFNLVFVFPKLLQNTFMLIFFSSIGLSADFGRLKQGGFPLVVFLIVVSFFILVQNGVGVGLAVLMDQNPLIGLITGSITLTGGHGTGGGYGDLFATKYGIVGAVEMAMVSATFGLVAGGLIGGPIARYILNKMGRKPTNVSDTELDDPIKYDGQTLESVSHQRLITAKSAIETMALFAACLSFSAIMVKLLPEVRIPQFVWALGFGVILRNTLTIIFKFDMFDRAIDVFGNASLSLFLAMALMATQLWQLSGIAGPMLVILIIQTIVMILFAYFVTFRTMGGDYDSAVLAAGHCGFGLGATPTAVANMQSITSVFGPSHKAFLIVPLVGAFFIDLVNFTILNFLIEILS